MSSSWSSDEERETEPWTTWFCNLKEHKMFCVVQRMYMEDQFNLYGLRQQVSNYSECIDLILDRTNLNDDSQKDSEGLIQNACILYGLIHARYIITTHGLDTMYQKFLQQGECLISLIPHITLLQQNYPSHSLTLTQPHSRSIQTLVPAPSSSATPNPSSRAALLT